MHLFELTAVNADPKPYNFEELYGQKQPFEHQVAIFSHPSEPPGTASRFQGLFLNRALPHGALGARFFQSYPKRFSEGTASGRAGGVDGATGGHRLGLH